MSLSFAVFWGLLVLLLTGNVGVPEPAQTQLRMLFLKHGMEQAEVTVLLRLDGRPPIGLSASNQASSVVYSIGGDHQLTLDYQYDFQRDKSLLCAARLTHGKKTIMQLAAPNANDNPHWKGLAPRPFDALRDLASPKVLK